jgi:hypothetical protein
VPEFRAYLQFFSAVVFKERCLGLNQQP